LLWAEEVDSFLGFDPETETNLRIAIEGRTASQNADAKLASQGNYSAHTGVVMGTITNKACGLDIHKKFIVATILRSGRPQNTGEVSANLKGSFSPERVDFGEQV